MSGGAHCHAGGLSRLFSGEIALIDTGVNNKLLRKAGRQWEGVWGSRQAAELRAAGFSEAQVREHLGVSEHAAQEPAQAQSVKPAPLPVQTPAQAPVVQVPAQLEPGVQAEPLASRAAGQAFERPQGGGSRDKVGAQYLNLPSALNVAALLNEDNACEYLLPGLRKRSVGLVMSPGGLGKSFWLLSVCAAASGVPGANLAGFPVATGAVLMLSAEEDQHLLGERLRAHTALMVRAGLPEIQAIKAWESMQLYSFFGREPDIMQETWFMQVSALAQRSKAQMIVFDTLSRFHRMDENNSADMSRLMGRLERLVRETGSAVMFMHHVAGGAQRGSSVLVDHARWASVLDTAPVRELPAWAQSKEAWAGEPDGLRLDSRYLQWKVIKQNYGDVTQSSAVLYERGAGGALAAVTA